MEIDVQYLIRALKYFTKNDDAELYEKDVKIIFNKILSQDMSHEGVKELIKNIKADIQWHKPNYVENFILTSSILHILINKQLRKHDLGTIFKDLFSILQTNGEIDKNNLKRFLSLCDNRILEDSSMSLSKFNFDIANLNKPVDYTAFLNLMEKYLKIQ
ncbi:hypothetical protein MKS88_005662 [Plasmodium brasilianum]|uniref:Uncharacterized protein n=2 Tax=Plasmodium (Plasmodium) TaxID=418103 RepID=A0A1A8WDA2_PLAMA|nr:conserved Plasmodium protein, unknown function [Plasmodium malariae]KAI4834981.1 hypothetical protein MKS88_005662 [Plasmodium brasilianum]SBS90991.1 conserved Plasmodium protein, unknown function [Plasmodium malariae]SCP03553.1 conserved Plasmodium protein, unknown function [Plasmodium malariae]